MPRIIRQILFSRKDAFSRRIWHTPLKDRISDLSTQELKCYEVASSTGRVEEKSRRFDRIKRNNDVVWKSSRLSAVRVSDVVRQFSLSTMIHLPAVPGAGCSPQGSRADPESPGCTTARRRSSNAAGFGDSAPESESTALSIKAMKCWKSVCTRSTARSCI